MHRTFVPALRHPRAALACLAAAAATGATLFAAPAAQAAPAQPSAAGVSLACFAEAASYYSGTVDCYPTLSGAAPFTVSWASTGGGQVYYSGPDEYYLGCGKGSTVVVTVTVTDATGATAQATRYGSCITGIPR
jgi:hypothetical protein